MIEWENTPAGESVQLCRAISFDKTHNYVQKGNNSLLPVNKLVSVFKVQHQQSIEYQISSITRF